MDMFDEGTVKCFDTKKHESFHQVVAQKIFISKCRRQDIQPTLAAFCEKC